MMLEKYNEILSGRRNPRFRSADLGSKEAEARRILRSCGLCERKCGADRIRGEKGFCGVGSEWSIFGAHSHWGEEDALVPSGTIFCAGCTMRCAYCQNAPASVTPGMGEAWSDQMVAEWIDSRHAEGCRNVNFVSPDCFMRNIIRALRLVKADIPVVWNSNSYYSAKAARILRGLVDVYLLDFRYFSEECAIRLSSAPGYPRAAKRNHLAAAGDSEVISRVLVMPNHIECDAKPILEWIRENLGPDTPVNILAQYRPCYRAHEHQEINRPLERPEHESVVRHARKIGLRNLV